MSDRPILSSDQIRRLLEAERRFEYVVGLKTDASPRLHRMWVEQMKPQIAALREALQDAQGLALNSPPDDPAGRLDAVDARITDALAVAEADKPHDGNER